MSRKQELYLDLLRLSAPIVRNILSKRFVFGRSRHEAYELSQLTHDLRVSIFEEDFIDHDFWILNVHAKSYFECAQNTASYALVSEILRELFLEVPFHLRHKLKWEGP